MVIMPLFTLQYGKVLYKVPMVIQYMTKLMKNISLLEAKILISEHKSLKSSASKFDKEINYLTY